MMGLDTVIVLGILIIATMVAFYLIIGGMGTIVDTTSLSLDSMYENRLNRMNTKIQIEDISGDERSLYIYVSNDGSTKIKNLNKMDLIVYGDGWTEWMHYTENSYLSPGEWKIREIQNDVLNPGILDPGEEMVIEVYPAHISYLADSDNYIKIITPNGAEGTKYFRGG
jgi:flagellar protein FlaF